MDNIFLLEDDSFALIDYESKYEQLNKLKYLGYILRCLRGLAREGYNLSQIHLRFIVIYTADVRHKTTQPVLTAGALILHTEEAFLSDIDGEKEYRLLTEKMKQNEPFTDEDLMKLIILPLTYQGTPKKQEAALTAVQLAETIPDPDQQAFALARLLSFSDKIITKELANEIRRYLTMTKVGMIIEQEKLEYGKEVEERVTREVTERVTKEVTENVTKEVTENVTKEVTANVTKEVTENVTKDVTANVTEKMLNKAVNSLVMLYRQMNGSMSDVVENIVINYGLSEDTAKEKVTRCWK